MYGNSALFTHYPVALPPSRDASKRDSAWALRFAQATAYLWGRMDMGEKRDVNRNFKFAEWYADEYWRWDRHERVSMPALYRALELFDAGEAF